MYFKMLPFESDIEFKEKLLWLINNSILIYYQKPCLMSSLFPSVCFSGTQYRTVILCSLLYLGLSVNRSASEHSKQHCTEVLSDGYEFL